MYNPGYHDVQPQDKMAANSRWQYTPEFAAMSTPINFAAQGAAMVGVGVAVMFLICILPYCNMQQVSLHNNNLIAGFLIEKLDISASLWDIHMWPVCTMQGIPLLDQLGPLLCHATDGLWGHHLLLDMNSHACNLEESLRSLRWLSDFLFRGAWGCDKFNVMSVGALITIAMTLLAAVCHICAAMNVFTYYYQDTSRLRRMYILMFSMGAPFSAVTGLLSYLLLFDISHLIVPGTLRPARGIVYLVGWGTVLLCAATLFSLGATAVLLLFLDKLPDEAETLKYEQYTNYSAMMQQEAMVQQHPGHLRPADTGATPDAMAGQMGYADPRIAGQIYAVMPPSPPPIAPLGVDGVHRY